MGCHRCGLRSRRLAAAAEAAAQGMRVLVLEAEPEPGGASGISRAGCCLVGTPLQAARGVQDSPGLALRDWRRAGGPSADLTWAARYLAESCTEVFAWCEDLGIRWSQLRQEEGNSLPRWHLPEGGGPAVIEALLGRCRSLGVIVRTSSPATQIVYEDGRARGVVVSTAQHTSRILADATIVCTGGFTSNRGMLQRHTPALATMARFLCGGSPAARGTGHDMLSDAGAAFACLDKLWMYPVGTPDPSDPSGKPRPRGARCSQRDLANSSGRAFTMRICGAVSPVFPRCSRSRARPPGASSTPGRRPASRC